ncbi:unnamed protein product [Lepeophtheirus salmonis]|uniref:(salmon louse) hypothetical protein n=1 Tax=Lepeophtheirus salmonis TaxID=72036 RepID=A0A7R8GZV7_LEPSM|nr:unnamed protein product [Lepeophtheirus salmonis]CAF2772203.1 unnamed protein product [Lepeophtheirus salmonis]
MSNSHRSPSWSSRDDHIEGNASLDEDWEVTPPRKRSRRYSSTSSSSSLESSRQTLRKRSLSCSSYSSDSLEGEQSRSRPLELSEDADTELMCHRKRALALGHFRLLYRIDGGVSLEDTKTFRDAMRDFDGKIRYVKVPTGFVGSHYPKTRYSKLRISQPCPGIGTRFNVVWSLPSGEVQIDYSVKLYDFDAIQSVEIECDAKSPKSPWFGLVDPRVIPTYDEKHFRTCGIEELAIPPSIPINLSSNRREKEVKSGGNPSTIRGNDNLVVLAGSRLSSDDYSVRSEELNTRYTGCVTEWRGNFGFLSCTHINGRVFLHSSDIIWSSDTRERLIELPIGASVNFELTLDAQKSQELGMRVKNIYLCNYNETLCYQINTI